SAKTAGAAVPVRGTDEELTSALPCPHGTPLRRFAQWPEWERYGNPQSEGSRQSLPCPLSPLPHSCHPGKRSKWKSSRCCRNRQISKCHPAHATHGEFSSAQIPAWTLARRIL